MMGLFAWLFRKRKQERIDDPTVNWPVPMRGDYILLPAALDWFDWTDYDSPLLSVDGFGIVRLHDWYAWRVGIEWHSYDYQVIGQIAPPGAAWVSMYWMRPSWYDEFIVAPALIEEARYVA